MADEERTTNWDFYWAQIGDDPASISVDLDLHDSAPQEERPWIIEVTFPLNSPNPTGWPTGEERPAINELEERISEQLEETCNAIQAGRIFKAGECGLYYYASKAGLDSELAIQSAVKGVTDYSAKSRSWEDPEWEDYFGTLFPNPMAFQFIETRDECDLLEQLSIDLDQPRAIHHEAVFSDKEARTRFVDTIASEGFMAEEERLETRDGQPGFMLVFSRQDGLEFSHIRPVVDKLFVAAGNEDGFYLGWEVPELAGDRERLKHRLSDEEVFENLRESKFDFSKEHKVDHGFATSSRPLAMKLVEKLRSLGFAVDDPEDPPAGEDTIMFEASLRCPLDIEVIHKQVLNMLDLAREYDVEYDGWGVLQE